MSATATTTWEVLTESVRGSTHVGSGLPNQDAVAVRRLDDGRTTVAAVADGHGGQRYVRSDTGACFAVELACQIFGDWWVDGDGRFVDEAHMRSAVHAVGSSLVARWRETVLDHVARNPFTSEENQRAGIELESDPVVAYGATLLAAIADPDRVLLAQLGDGDILTVRSDGSVVRPIPEDDRLVAGQTTSLCLVGAENDIRSSLLSSDMAAELVVLCSDGYGNSFADESWALSAGRDLRDVLHSRGMADVGQDLKGWLRASADAGGDDVTVALLARRVNGADAVVTPSVKDPIANGPAGGRVGWGLLAGLIAGALLIGGLCGWLIRGSDESVASTAGEGLQVSSSTTSVPPAPPQPAELIVTGPAGSSIRFRPDPFDPRARASGVNDTGAIVTRLVRDGVVWEIDDRGRLLARTGGGRTSTVPTESAVGSIHSQDVYLWVVARDETTLFIVDPASRAVIGAHPIGQTALDDSPIGSGEPEDQSEGREGQQGGSGTSGGGESSGR